MEKYLEMLKSHGAALAIKTDAATVVTAPWTLYKCQYGCDMYGTNLKCPPYTPTWRETRDMLSDFTTAILFMAHNTNQVNTLAVDLSRQLFLDDYYKVIAFGADACTRCQTCTLTTCVRPGETLPGMDACGIDVYATVRANGLTLHTLKDKASVPDHYGLILVE